jgi:hypothetical protein
MKIFISWSGNRGRRVAEALRFWLEDVHHTVKPWLSAEDLDPGTRWNSELAKQLEETHYGIICLTPESVLSPWLLFEAGALAKVVGSSRVCPYLFQLEPRDLPAPLSQFDAVTANQSGTLKLVRGINRSVDDGSRLPNDRLKRYFEKWWPDLQNALELIPPLPVHSDMPLLSAKSFGLERICRSRAEALHYLGPALREEAQREPNSKSLVYITGTSLRGFMVPATEGFDGPQLLRELLLSKCHLRFMLTHPKVAERRAKQEKRDEGAIANEVKSTVSQLLEMGVKPADIRYYKGSPTMFGIATTERMLLNPYPYENESRRCMSLIIRKTEEPDDIYHQYLTGHFENPWKNAVPVSSADTLQFAVTPAAADYKE